jgi:HK97 family phage prohead protease
MKLDRALVTFDVKGLSEKDGTRTFEGYGSVFDTVDSYDDTIVKGAYAVTLAEWKSKGKLPKMLLQHGGGGFFSRNADDMIPIGKWEDMYEDDHGLFMRGRLFDVDTDRAKATYAALKEGELDGLSIGFFSRQADVDEKTGIRTLKQIELMEVSLVTFPANDPARVTAVKAATELPTEREFERWLRRDVGLTESHAKAVIAKGYRQVRREAMPSEEACGELLSLIHQRSALVTGDQTHGTAGS